LHARGHDRGLLRAEALLRGLLLALLRSFSLDHLLLWDPAGQLVTPVRWNSGSRVVSELEDSTGEKAQGLRTRGTRDSNHKSEREKSEGEKRSPPTLFLLFTDFYYYFNWLKNSILFFFVLLPFFDIWTKNVFPLFWPMIVIYFFT
jgi:hypothetical protein